MPVVDASVIVEYVSAGEYAAEARQIVLSAYRPGIEEQLGEPAGVALWAPHLIDAEVGHALRSVVARGELSAEAAADAVDDLADLPLVRSGQTALLARAWELRDNISFYDGIYVALAERIGAPLVTVDARLARAARGLVDVQLIGES